MTRLVYCKKYKKQLPGLDKQPYPGNKGKEIFETISKQAWSEWQNHQTMLINEKHLNLMNPEDRKFLLKEMDLFLAGKDYTNIEGYIPKK